MSNYEPSVFEKYAAAMSAMRQLGDNVRNEKNHIFAFPTAPIASGRSLLLPTNYDLVEVLGEEGPECGNDEFSYIIDPRAGRGPWISGTKKDSMVGSAKQKIGRTFFSPFSKFPAPGQTMEAVVYGQRDYIKMVQDSLGTRLKVVKGNCSAGWLLELIANDAELFTQDDIIITNGSPKSFWYDSDNYIYTKGRFFGGEWGVRLLCDLMGGIFDGAFLSQNFEENDWLKVVFDKYTTLWKSPTRSAIDKFLQDEKWWTFFTYFSKEELVWILRNLFLGNRLERGLAELNCHRIDLRQTKATRLIFCSWGDGITSVAHALGFIPQVYKSVGEMKELRAKVVYCIDDKCGHLSIFVSRAITKRYHANFFKYRNRIRELPPGLWQMIISPDGQEVRFEERTMVDIIRLLPRNHVEQYRQGKVFSDESERLGQLYESTIGPYVRTYGKINQALLREVWEKCHPMRLTRTIFSSRNPLMRLVPEVTLSVPDAPNKEASQTNFFTPTPLLNMVGDVVTSAARAWSEYILNGWRTIFSFWTVSALEKKASVHFPIHNCAGCVDEGASYMVCGNCPGFKKPEGLTRNGGVALANVIQS